MISQRLSYLLSCETTFDGAKDEYQKALEISGYKDIISYNPEDKKSTCRKRKRRRNIIYFQPPYSSTVKTPIGKLFLKLIKKHFDTKHPLYKILNHRTLKLSYSCLNNVKAMITGNNKKVLSEENKKEKNECNCQKSRICPVNNKCQLENVVYEAEITSKDGTKKIYVGSTGNTFKKRFQAHKTTLNTKDHSKGTALSRHFWVAKTKDQQDPDIKWKIIKKTKALANEKSGCLLCNLEKITIAKTKKEQSLNVRNELVSSCPHYRGSYFKKPVKEKRTIGTG